MKAKHRSSGVLCFCLLFLAQVWRAGAQDAPQQPAPPPTPQQAPETQPAPPPKIKVQEHDTGGDVLSIAPLFWLTKNPPRLREGRAAFQSNPGNLDFPGGSQHGVGGIITIPTGSENSLQFSYFRVQGHGSTTATQDLTLFSNPFFQGDVLATSYKLQNFKLSWNYLTYPHPSNGAKLRIKTLWELQYTTISPLVDAPADPNVTPSGNGKSIFYPTLGLGIESHLGKHVRLEVKGSGFGYYHSAAIWDTEGSAAFHYGPVEILLGGKAYHFKTSPKSDEYLSDTLWGPFVALRWILR